MNSPAFRLTAFLVLFVFIPLSAQEEKPPQTNNDSQDNADTAKLVARWTFEKNEPGTWKGKKEIVPTGPQSPLFPDFPAGNKAGRFDGKSSFAVKDADVGQSLAFDKGETITLEAWVNLEEIKNGEYCYLLGKGRNKSEQFSPENQNYALRLAGVGGEAHPSFLFRSAGAKGEFHRWVASGGFRTKTGWHHVAVRYTFGKPDSIFGIVDGRLLEGKWDMGGKTDKAPVTDADAVTVGTGNGGGASNSFRGQLDEIAIHRGQISDKTLMSRFHFKPSVPTVDRIKVPAGKVLVEIAEDIPSANAFPLLPPTYAESYTEDCFGLFEVPHKYIEGAIRGDRPIPYLLRASALVKLPPGKHRLLLRGRGASHLYIDEKPLLETGFETRDSSGHSPIPTNYLDLGPDFRFAPPGNREVWTTITSSGSEQLVVLETLVGMLQGKAKRRPELGETVVAWSKEGSNTWHLLAPGNRIVPYTDEGWADYERERRQRLEILNHRNRLANGDAEFQTYWKQRREAANEWLKTAPQVAVPKVKNEGNAIDQFIFAKLEELKKEAPPKNATVNFHREILPILESKCFSCHTGTKVKGGLNLENRATATKGGENGAALVPGSIDKSAILHRVASKDADTLMPPKGEPLTKDQVDLLSKWVAEGASWPSLSVQRLEPTPVCDDLTFLRRVTLDLWGIVPDEKLIEEFRKDNRPDKRKHLVERLLENKRLWADHWVGYWQDVLAENPNILNPTLNNTGPFRWFLHEAFYDNRPFDVFVTQLVQMHGSERFGGPRGFAIASQNDVPMAAKGTIVSTAFLGVEMKCARCHDAPYHQSTQKDLFSLAALLESKPVSVPGTSSVSLDKLGAGDRKPLISVTLKPGTKVELAWPFPQFCDEAVTQTLLPNNAGPRERLATLLTAPQNERFAEVIVNRVWKRLMGRGIVEPVDDWEKGKASHPELLKWLAREFVRSGYDLKHVAKLIVNAEAYQRQVDPKLTTADASFAAPARRRLQAEQIVDSLFAATGKPMNVGEISLDIDGLREMNSSISLGKADKAWMFTSTSNERDRPSLSLPRAQAIVDVLEAFGWRSSRQDPLSVRDSASNVIQPALLANGVMSVWLTRLSDDHGTAQLALGNQSAEQLVDRIYLRFLTRLPTAAEKTRALAILNEGYADRLKVDAAPPKAERKAPRYVSWSNHLQPEANDIMKEMEARARRGDPPTAKLNPQWRERLEDVVWSLVNAPEMIYYP